MKGKVKIEFTDKNGKVTKVVEKDNLVTNAIPNLLTGFTKYWYMVKNKSNAADAGLNNGTFPVTLAQSLFNGLLVFNDNLSDVNVDHILPTADDISKCVGGANSDTSTTILEKGTFNEQESEFTDAYAKFVFNFSASELYNVDIGAFALTSDLGGQYPLRFNSIDTTKGKQIQAPLANMWNKATGNPVESTLHCELTELSVSQSNNNTQIGYYDETNNKFVFGRYYRGTILKREIPLANILKLGTNSDCKVGIVDSGKETTLSTTSVTQSDKWLPAVGYCKNFIISQRHIAYSSQTSVYKFNMLDGTETNLGNWNSDFRTAVRNWSTSTSQIITCYREENDVPYIYIIALNSAKDTFRVWKANINNNGAGFTYADTVIGTEMNTLLGDATSTSSWGTPQWVNIDGQLYFTSLRNVGASGQNVYNLFKLNDDLTLNQYASSQINAAPNNYRNLVASPILPKPWLVLLTSDTSVPKFHTPVVRTQYLGTIANLDAVLTKPADQGMKVTYVLTNA
jgi:hypothetical protein